MTVIHFIIPLLESEETDVRITYHPSLCTRSIKLREQKPLNHIKLGTNGDAKTLSTKRRDKDSILGGGRVADGKHIGKSGLGQRRRGQRRREPQNPSDNGVPQRCLEVPAGS